MESRRSATAERFGQYKQPNGRREVGVRRSSDDVGELVQRTLLSEGAHHEQDLLEGTMTESLRSKHISTKLEQIAKRSREIPNASLMTLAHFVDEEWLSEAYRRTRKDGARGVDGQTAEQYAKQLESNLGRLLAELKSGTYRAPPVRRVHIPKGDGTELRPIGVPTFEDKVAQRAIAMVISEVYEQEFYDFSYGFRPGRSAHQALLAIRKAATKMYGGWVVEVDIRKFFDSVDHEHLRKFLHRRIGDRVLLRLIGKWLKAGVLEDAMLSRPDEGTPQGGVISPVLANIFLHEVFDRWFATDIVPALQGEAIPVRYADDILVLFERESDAKRFLRVLPKRFGRFGLEVHPAKTRMVGFRNPRFSTTGADCGTFDFLGFTHYWERSRRGWWVVKQRTAKDRFNRALHRLHEWCRWHKHDSLETQHSMIAKKLLGHYAYYGVPKNFDALERFKDRVIYIWKKALERRSQRGLTWRTMVSILKRYPLPVPRIVQRSVT